MKNLETLIQELCPDGVEFVKLGEVMDIYRGASPRPIQKYLTTEKNGVNWIKIGDVEDNAKYIISTKEKITQEGAAKSRFLHKGDLILSNSMSFGRPYILAIDGCIHDGWISMSGYDGKLLPDFLYHLLRSYNIQKYWRQKASSGTVSNLNADIVRKTEIPLPPIEVQTEIVRILDKFTSLEAELEAEQDFRKRQYEYYRDKLLSFDNVGGQEVEWKKMSEVCEIYDGTHQTPKYQSGGIPFISVENIKDIYGSNKYISLEDYESYKIKPKVGDVFMTRIGSIGVCTVFTKQADIAYYVSLALLRPNKEILDSRYLKHFIESAIGRKELGKRILHNAVPIKINKSDIGKVKLLIPSLEEQHRIVSILDRFESLTTSLQSGLPAEISARRQQYEYYRDKLLTFKRKGAA